jgi:hypothetical protein
MTPNLMALAEALAYPADASMAYLQGQMRPSQGPLLEAYAAESEATIAALKPRLDMSATSPGAALLLITTQAIGNPATRRRSASSPLPSCLSGSTWRWSIIRCVRM